MFEEKVNTTAESVQDVYTYNSAGGGDRMLQEALDIAKLGLAVFPCMGKKPAISEEEGGKGFYDATTNPDRIRELWGKRPRSNIGVRTGETSGLWVLDVDGDDAEQALIGLEAKHGALPETVTCISGGPGSRRHLYFRHPGTHVFNRKGDIGPHLDSRGDGGYIIVPPSIHPDTKRRYQWKDGVLPDRDSLPDAPSWLVELVTGPSAKGREWLRNQQNKPARPAGKTPSNGSGGSDAYYRAALDGECREVAQTKEGRNDRLNIAACKLGGYVAGGHLKRDVVERALFEAAETCGYVASDGERATRATINSGLTAGIAKGPKSAPEREPKLQKSPRDSKSAPTSSSAPTTKSMPPWIDSIDGVLDAFNQRYAVVNEAGKAVIYNPKHDPQLKRNTIERITFDDFKRMYMNRRLQVGTSKKGGAIYSDFGTIWLEHHARRQFLGGVVMDPTNSAPDDCWNLWRGFNVEPVAGDWSLMRNHIKDIVCGGDEALFNYVLGWLARMIQHPNQPGEVALVMRGKKGTGKGTLGNWMLRLMGQHGVKVEHAKHLVGNFNAHLRDAVFVFADEAFFAGDKQNEGVLKSLITEPYITVEAKYQNAATIANMTHIIMASNSDWVVPASGEERRFCVMNVSDDKIQNIEYFNELNAQMENGGLSAMLHELLHHDLSNFNVRVVPQTSALADQKRLSMDSLHRWWTTVLERGFVWRSRYGAPIFMQWNSGFVSTELLHRSYLQWCAENREGRPMGREQLGVMMKTLYKPHRPRGEHPVFEKESMDKNDMNPAAMQLRPQGYVPGSLDDARKVFCEKTRIDFDWGDEEGENAID
jgi:hypothetical protein